MFKSLPPPRLCLITNGKRSEVLITLNLIKEKNKDI